jgi:D-alanyl-D-alanine carboxypeptidase/D-alanyl-D-alanine-endopeptidase (penicillin-binding protein 4)
MRMNRLYYILVCAAWTLLTPAVSQAQSSVSEILRTANPQKEKFSIIVIRADSGKVLFSRDADHPMIPASNMKLVVSAAALHYLGPDYTFQTRVGLLGKNLVVIGGGDPLLGEPGLQGPTPGWIFEQIAEELSKNGISAIEDILLDDTFFDSNRVHPQWPPDQLNRWYACEVSGLNFNRNCIRLSARRTSGGPVVEIDPPTGYVHLKNQVNLVSKGDSAIGAYRSQQPNFLVVKGTLNQAAGFDVAIENPAGLFGALLREKLTAQGIKVKGKLVQKYVKTDPNIRILRTFHTPLQEVLNCTNKDSLGLAAEALVKTISAENTQGKINGEWPHGLHLIERYLLSLGIPADQFALKDGSGLCRDNRLSPRAIVTVLQDMTKKSYWPVYEFSLSQGGLDGTAEKYFKETPYRGNIAGKTGYINGVRAFSGICHTEQGDLLFSILTEGGNGRTRAKINEITKAVFLGRW